MSNPPARTTLLGHGAGTANGTLNNNKAHAQIGSNNSLFNWKTATYEVHVHQQESSLASKALVIGTGIAVGVAALWGAGQMFSTRNAELEEKGEEEGGGGQERVVEDRTTTRVSAGAKLEVVRNRRRELS
jgi:hypothetical protein